MAVTLSGRLYDPFGNALENASVRFRAARTSTQILANYQAETTTDSSGDYSITVRYGVYHIEARQSTSEPWYTIARSIPVTVDTTSTDINSLIVAYLGAQDATPEIVTEIEGVAAQAVAAQAAAEAAAESATQTVIQREIWVQDIASAEAVDVSGIPSGQGLRITTGGRRGTFSWGDGDLSGEVSSDPSQGIYIAPASDPTGASGAWVRGIEGYVYPRFFGVTSNPTDNNSVAFRAFWEFLRSQWFDLGVRHKSMIDTSILLESPEEDRDGIAVFVYDFSGSIFCTRGSVISVTGSTANAIIQIGTYSTNSLYRGISDVHVDGDGTAGGFVFADCFQGRLVAANLVAENCTTAYKAVNVQEIFAKSLAAKNPEVGFVVSASNEPRADGSNGAYSTGVGTSISNNNHFEVFIQAPSVSGIENYQGTQNKFSGLVQGSDSTGWFVDVIGGSEFSLQDLWLESSTAVHRELIFRDTFTASAILNNVHGATTGAQASIQGGNITWVGSNTWVGRIDVTGDGALSTDYRGGAARTGNIAYTADSLPVSKDASASYVMPNNRAEFHKGEVAAEGSYMWASFGNDASGNESKGLRAYVNIWKVDGTAQCTLEIFADGRASFPSVRQSVVEKLGTLADVGCSINLTKVGSSPYHLMRAFLVNDNTDTEVKFEIWSHRFMF